MIAATCATLAGLLASADGGETYRLRGDCERIQIARAFPAQVTIDASDATIRGLALSGENLVWRGGKISAPAGAAGRGPAGYAVHITGRNLAVESALITGARMGVVVSRAANIAVRGNRFWQLSSDGVHVSRTAGLQVVRNNFFGDQPAPGEHPDAIQMRNGVTDAVIEENVVRGQTQGIAQMDTTGDLPLERIVIRRNSVRVNYYHTITLSNCLDCRIEDNEVTRGHAERKAVIRAGQALRCGNRAQDEPKDKRCR